METKKLLSDVKKHLDSTNIEEGFSLDSIMSLGGDWDDPIKLGRALDEHPVIEAKYAKLLSTLETALNEEKAKLSAFESHCKSILGEIIFYENRAAGMTANQSKATIDGVKTRFAIDIVDGDEEDEKVFAVPVNMDKVLANKSEPEYDTETTYGDCVRRYKAMSKAVAKYELHRSNVHIVTKELNTRTSMLKCSTQLVTAMIQAGLLKIPAITKTKLQRNKNAERES